MGKYLANYKDYECEIFRVLFCYIHQCRWFSALCYYTFKLSMESYGMYIISFWCFYVIIKMLTYTYRWRFLFEVNNSYTRALIEVFSPLTRKTATGSSDEMLPLQNLWKEFPLWPNMWYLKLNYRQIIWFICPFHYFSKILNIWVRRRQRWLFWCLYFQP